MLSGVSKFATTPCLHAKTSFAVNERVHPYHYVAASCPIPDADACGKLDYEVTTRLMALQKQAVRGK